MLTQSVSVGIIGRIWGGWNFISPHIVRNIWYIRHVMLSTGRQVCPHNRQPPSQQHHTIWRGGPCNSAKGGITFCEHKYVDCLWDFFARKTRWLDMEMIHAGPLVVKMIPAKNDVAVSRNGNQNNLGQIKRRDEWFPRLGFVRNTLQTWKEME